MTVFRTVSSLLILGLLGWMAYDLRHRLGSWKAVRSLLGHHAGSVGRDLRGGERSGGWREYFRKSLYLLTAGLMLLLAITGFIPILLFGDHVSGFLLVIHVTAAPLFALSLSALTLFWAHRMSFREADWHTLKALVRRVGRGPERHDPVGPDREALVSFALKAGFWMILTLSLPLMLTIIFGLFPLFGTEGEALLIRLHGYSALLLLLAALTDLYLTIITLERMRASFHKESKP